MRRYFGPIGGTMRRDWVAAQICRIKDSNHIPPFTWPLPNVWLGVSAENQATADKRVPFLLDTPAAVRFVSCEPLLGPVRILGWLMQGIDPGRCLNCGGLHGFSRDPNYGGVAPANDKTGCKDFKRADFALHWVIAGGETGAGARPMHPDWARGLRDQCKVSGTPFFFKSWGEWLPGQNDPHPQQQSGVAHWQDGAWGVRFPHRDSDKRYVVWRSDGSATYGNQEAVARYREITAFAQRIGKKRAGRLLDGVEHNEFPEVRRDV
jgi:hypothetical protein